MKLALGTLAGFILAIVSAPFLQPLFGPPSGGVGMTTVTGYPKSFDHFAALWITALAALGGILAARRPRPEPVPDEPPGAIAVGVTALALFALYFFVHDYRYHEMDLFHEGEHLSPAAVMAAGGRPYGDVFILHGLATDGGIDVLLGVNPLRARIAQTVLDAATIALLAPVAAELVATTPALAGAVFAAFCALGAGQVKVFPYFRLAPLLLAAWALLRYQRSGRRLPLVLSGVAAGIGVLWSLEVGLYSGAALIAFLLLQKKVREASIAAAAAGGSMLVILLLARADLAQFAVDSFGIIPRSMDAVWGVPAHAIPAAIRDWFFFSEPARYYLAPAFSGALLALAWYRRSPAMLAVALFSIALFRTATGRTGWGHTRFALPLLGIAVVAFLLEPLLRRRKWIAATVVVVILVPFLEVRANAMAAWKAIGEWRGRIERPAGSVPHPLPAGRGLYTSPENAADLLLLADLARTHAPGGKPIFVFSGEKALYFLLGRPASTRLHDVPMMSVPALHREALAQLAARPPAFVIVGGPSRLDQFDGVTNRDRVPEIARWIDERYPVRVPVGRYVVALPR